MLVILDDEGLAVRFDDVILGKGRALIQFAMINNFREKEIDGLQSRTGTDPYQKYDV